MKAKFWICSLLVVSAVLAIAKGGDPVLMTINGKDIRLSEFEYLYNKNNQQQVEKETLEQYVDRFVLYKLKVADAEAAGIDTTALFKREFEGYQKDLIAPFLAEDTTYRWQFINEAYQRYLKEVNMDHIMLPLGKTAEEKQRSLVLMDSIRNCILNGESWESMADRYSIDPYKSSNHGRFGFVSSLMFPYEIENVFYSTPVGQVSMPFSTKLGVHMVRVNAVRDREDIRARHILKLFPRNATEEQKAQCKQKIDSIYALLLAGADFAEMAMKESEDPGSAQRGGDLNWFGRGKMVQPFEDIAFSLADGEISEPFETRYGYHIIKKEAHGVASFNDIRPVIEERISRDSRKMMIFERHLGDLKSKFNFRSNPEAEKFLTNALTSGLDSTFLPKIKDCTMPLFTYGDGKSVPVSALVPQLPPKAKILDPEKSMDFIHSLVDLVTETTLAECNAMELVNTNAEFRNLLNEYRDGMLLFEISNRRVWQAASKDTVGLEQYYAANRDKYTWNEPYFKGIILSAKSDSILELVKADVNKFGADTLTQALYNKYGTDIRQQSMVVKQGDNNLADYMVFHTGDKPKQMGYPAFMVLQGGIIYQPEGLNDVRGNVTSDYQDVLEQRWKEELYKKYPVKINKKVLKQVK